jgi:hypothetical protein
VITREEFIKETVVGKRVVHRASGVTGEVRLVIPDWGVEVWNFSDKYPRKGERERWSWAMITKRFPRDIKRFPRPFRFPRLLPTLQCHCKIGKMEVIGVSQVKCLRCNFAGSIDRHVLETSNLLSMRHSDLLTKRRDLQSGRLFLEFKVGRKRKHHRRVRVIWSFDLEGERRKQMAQQKADAKSKGKEIRRFPRTPRFPRLPGIINGKKVEEKPSQAK